MLPSYNTLSNYRTRVALQFLTAPQSGYVNKALKAGIGETFSRRKLISIMPNDYQMAVETYIRPIDIPLIKVEKKARVEFDGWPAIVFSGWPSVSYGTYGAKVVAIENYISDNDLYRVLLVPDENDHPWPTEVRIGSGAEQLHCSMKYRFGMSYGVNSMVFRLIITKLKLLKK